MEKYLYFTQGGSLYAAMLFYNAADLPARRTIIGTTTKLHPHLVLHNFKDIPPHEFDERLLLTPQDIQRIMEKSPLKWAPIISRNFIAGTPPDYLHLIPLGIQTDLIEYVIRGRNLREENRRLIAKFWRGINPCFPSFPQILSLKG